jgi:hypothetical protein
VQELSLVGVDPEERNWIGGLAFTPVGENVRGELELMDGMRGLIVARQVEIVDVRPALVRTNFRNSVAFRHARGSDDDRLTAMSTSSLIGF